MAGLHENESCSLPFRLPYGARPGEYILRIVVLREIPEDELLLRSWNELVRQMKRPEVFYTCEWALAVQSAYRPQRNPLVFLGYEGDTLVGVVCLATEAGSPQVSFLTSTTADYCEFLSHPQRRKEFVERVLAEFRELKLSRLVLANLPADSTTPPVLRAAAKKHGFNLYIRPAYRCPQVKLGAAAQRDEFKTAVMRKRQLRRCLKALEREGPVTCCYLRTWEQVEPVLSYFTDKHVARFRTTKHASFLSTAERRIFMQELARRFCEAGIMTLTMLSVGDRPVAWSYGFQFHGIWFLYQTTFDIRSEENSPGYCLLAKILIEASGMNTLHLVDMGLGAEAYKEWFANSSRQTLHATLTTSPVRHWREIARYRVAKKVKSFPKLEAAIRRMRSRLQS
jgi:CelD/BcsL family acetyltransferase involved in cellulose biosynthesis